MAFSMRKSLKDGLLQAIGKQAAYQILQQASGWRDKGVFLESDLEEIRAALKEAGQLDDLKT